jgi:hypothetical protein
MDKNLETAAILAMLRNVRGAARAGDKDAGGDLREGVLEKSDFYCED